MLLLLCVWNNKIHVYGERNIPCDWWWLSHLKHNNIHITVIVFIFSSILALVCNMSATTAINVVFPNWFHPASMLSLKCSFIYVPHPLIDQTHWKDAFTLTMYSHGEAIIGMGHVICVLFIYMYMCTISLIYCTD